MLACVLGIGAALEQSRALSQELSWNTWAEAASKQHPLAGSVYDAALNILVRSLRGNESGLVLPAGIVLLGEVHDNPMHHRIRAWLIELSSQARPSWRPAVVFEQIRTDQQAALDQFQRARKAGRATAGDLFRLLSWEASGWPPADVYRPLFEAVIAADLPIYAGDPPRERVRALARATSLPAEERARLRLDDPMPQPLLDTLHEELRASHCGVLPETALGGMSMAQRYRDAHLADVLLSAVERHQSAILIAGNGHIRRDRGVPWHIRQRVPNMKVTSVMVVEVEEGQTDPASYVPRDPDGRPAADQLIFTLRAERDDPCEKMRRRNP